MDSKCRLGDPALDSGYTSMRCNGFSHAQDHCTRKRWWIVAAAAMTVSKKYRKYGIAMFAALAAGVLVGNVCLKHLIARSRPCWIESVSLLIGNPTDYSFPSGHTLSSVIGAFMLTAANRKFGLLAIPLAALISFSRLYLYVHFPSDVLASVVIGVLLGSIAVYAMTKVRAPLFLRKK